MQKASLYIIPVLLGGDNVTDLLPEGTLQKIRSLKHFIVENEKSARQFLKLAGITTPQNELVIMEIDKHADSIDENFLQHALNGNDTGLLSEAGAPAVADPGSGYIYAAHKQGLKVVPLTGPSSLLLALMASGLNGQSFCFHGYLPVNSDERIRKIKLIEKDAQTRKQTQIFIETPYRNNQLLKDLAGNLNAQTKLCIASNITMEDEYILTQTVEKWKKDLPDLHKKPCVFLLL